MVHPACSRSILNLCNTAGTGTVPGCGIGFICCAVNIEGERRRTGLDRPEIKEYGAEQQGNQQYALSHGRHPSLRGGFDPLPAAYVGTEDGLLGGSGNRSCPC